MKTTTLACNTDGVRLDIYLSDSLEGLTRNAAQKLLNSGQVAVIVSENAAAEKTIVKKNYRTSFGEIYLVEQEEPELSAVTGQNIGLDVIYEDDDVIVVNKPRGMVVHPAPGHASGTLVNALIYHCGDSLSGIGGVLRPGIVHRIDKDTSGLIIAAKNDKAHLSLAKQLASRTLAREYDAVVCGCIKDNGGTVDAPIGRHPADRKKQAVCGTRNAVTHYEVLALYTGYTHIRCKLETGRTHQIRVHMAYLGYPVLGDKVYGHKKTELGMDGQCLHARRLCFNHPSSGVPIDLRTDLPDYFEDVLEKLRKL